jgi:tryptophan synthase alpha chain
MNRIERKFKELKRQKRKAFIAFITAGYPSLAVTEKLVLEFARRGVDIIELGVPFSDPLADGPVIQEASLAALEKNVHLTDILALVKKARRLTDIPICLMTYYNPVFSFKEKKFLEKARQSGVDGVIVPDLTPEEGASFIRCARNKGVDVICFISPTSTLKRIKYVSGLSRGFIYYVSLTGVTGARQGLPSDLASKIRQIKRITRKPVCVGFGVSTPEQVRRINRFADGVIVGSVIVKKIREQSRSPGLVSKVGAFVSRLKG